MTRECDLCGKRFTLRTRGKVSKYCSDYCVRRSGAVRKYGLTNAEYKALVKDRKCNMCGRRINLRQFNVEHDHVSNEVYGAVCTRCNQTLALIRRSALTAFLTVDYLTMPPARLVRGEPVILPTSTVVKLSRAKPRYRRFRGNG